MPRKWIEVNDLSGGQYSVNKKIRSKTPMYRSDVFDYSDVNIVIKWKITVEGTNNVNKINKNLAFKIMLHLSHAYQKTITAWQTMQKLLILCQYIVCQNDNYYDNCSMTIKFDFPLFSCDLSWSKDCVISEISRTPEVQANPAAKPPIAHAPATETAGTIFQIRPSTYFVYKQ